MYEFKNIGISVTLAFIITGIDSTKGHDVSWLIIDFVSLFVMSWASLKLIESIAYKEKDKGDKNV